MANFITFLIEGPRAGVFNPYLADKHTPYIDSYVKSSFETAGFRLDNLAYRNNRSQLFALNGCRETKCLIDDCIIVKGYGEDHYKNGKEFWSFYKKITILTGCLVLAAGIGGSIAVFLHFGWVKALITFYIVSVSLALLTKRVSDAHTKMREWDDSALFMTVHKYIEIVAKNRIEVTREGWWKKELPGISPPFDVLTPLEKACLYQKKAKKCQQELDKMSNLGFEIKSSLLKNFFNLPELGDFVRPSAILLGQLPEFQKADSREIENKRQRCFQAIENAYNQVCDKLKRNNQRLTDAEVCQCLGDVQRIFNRILAATQNGKYDLPPSS